MPLGTQAKLLSVFAVSVLLVSCNNTSQHQIGIGSDPNGRNDQWGFIGPGGGGAMFNLRGAIWDT